MKKEKINVCIYIIHTFNSAIYLLESYENEQPLEQLKNI